MKIFRNLCRADHQQWPQTDEAGSGGGGGSNGTTKLPEFIPEALCVIGGCSEECGAF